MPFANFVVKKSNMKIGILSDTHGQSEIAARAVDLLRERGAEYLIHCGDVGGTEVLDAIAGGPAAFVFGNNDYDHDELREYARAIDILCFGPFGVLGLGGKRIAVTHGDDHGIIARLTQPDSACDYLFTGHTHVRHDKHVGAVRWINPGALYRAARKSVALLDLDDGSLISLPVAD